MKISNDIKRVRIDNLAERLRSNKIDVSNSYFSTDLAIVKAMDMLLNVASNIGSEAMILDEMRLMVISSGTVTVRINFQDFTFSDGDLLFLGANGVFDPSAVCLSDDFSGYALSVSTKMLDTVFRNVSPKILSESVRQFSVKLSDDDKCFLSQSHRLLLDYVLLHGQEGEVVKCMIASMMWYVDGLYSEKKVTQLSVSREQRLFADFIRLANEYAVKEHKLEFYADRLFLSARYLSSLIYKTSGKSVKGWLDEIIISRAKTALLYTDKTVSEISDDLCFPNASFFCKYFRRLTGVSPQSLRASVGKFRP